MATSIQVTIDCADPDRLAHFWAAALGYTVQGPPDGSESWHQYWLKQGIPEGELDEDIGDDRIVDPDGVGPPIWFQKVPEPKAGKNRLHLDLKVSGGRGAAPLDTRRHRVDAEVARLTALGGTTYRVLHTEGVDHYGVVMQDPEGNEFCVA